MHLSYILAPIIAKSYQASLTSAFTQNVNFALYLSVYTFIYSQFGAALLYIYIQCPICDFVKYLWFSLPASLGKKK